MSLQTDIEALVAQGDRTVAAEARDVFARLREALSAGEVRAAEPDQSTATGWRVNTWVKQGILLGFKFGDMVDASMDHGKLPFYDKDTLPLKKSGLAAGVRVSGCSVHLVDEGIDTGPVIAQAVVPVLPNDDESALHARIQRADGKG